MAAAMRDDWRLAWWALTYAGRFYWRYLWLVAAMSLVPASQRFASALWQELLAPYAVALEIVTTVVRVVFLVLVVWLALVKEPELQSLNAAQTWQRIARFARRRPVSVVIFIAMVAAATLVFDVIPDYVVAPMVPEPNQPLYWAVLLAVKNVTIIPFTVIWMVSMIRQAALDPPVARGEAEQGERPVADPTDRRQVVEQGDATAPPISAEPQT